MREMRFTTSERNVVFGAIVGALLSALGFVAVDVFNEISDDGDDTGEVVLFHCEENEVMFGDGTCKTLEQIYADAGLTETTP